MNAVNILPAPTWNWLRMNESTPEFAAAGEEEKRELLVAEGEEKTEILWFEEGFADRICSTDCRVKKNGSLTLVQVVAPKQEERLINSICCQLEEKASFHLIQLFLSGKEVYQETKVFLSGEKSAFKADVAYSLHGEQDLDMNYVADHTGKRSTSELNVHGVLDQKAKKLFRGTIDFHRGAKGAKGNELEEVLLLSKGVVNRTIPLILCDEEDVEGNHGASIGKLSEETMFYLTSRGIKEDEVYRMMARARLDLVTAMIPDEMIRERIHRYLSICHR